MKKKYIKPAIGREFMETFSLMVPSINHVDSEQTAVGSAENTVNLGRQGSFWDDAE